MSATLPPRYDAWMRTLLGEAVPGEPRSTCDACPKIGPGGPFLPEVRCCGFLPVLPNFTVGAILADAGRGADTVRARIAERVAVTPLGLGRPPVYAAAWQQVDFGRDAALACPHLWEGRCSVWPHREATCSTWFCRVDGEADGRAFWLALRGLLEASERVVAAWCAEALGARVGRYASWGSWSGGVEAFFLACNERAADLDWPALRRLGGFELRTRARDVRAAWEARCRALR